MPRLATAARPNTLRELAHARAGADGMTTGWRPSAEDATRCEAGGPDPHWTGGLPVWHG